MSNNSSEMDALFDIETAIETQAMAQTSNGLPDQIRAFDLVLKSTGAGIELEYAKSAVLDIGAETNTWSKFNDVLRDFLYDEQGNHRSFPKSVKFKDPSTNPRLPHVELSLRAPVYEYDGTLLAREAQRAFYVIRLRRKGNGTGIGNPNRDVFRYSTMFDPFSVSSSDVPDNDTYSFFSRPCLISPGSVELVDGEEHRPEKYGPTTEAGFLFDLFKLKEVTQRYGDDVQSVDSVPDFQFRFNMNLEIQTKARNGWSSDQFRRYLPIIIDPDIGHPGGNATGP